MWRWRGNNSTPDQPAMSILDQGCELEGRLAFSGTLVLNGKFQGELLSADTLIVGENGDLKADIQVGVAIVSGQLSGHITAKERVELRSTARMYGDIVTPVLVLEEGVIFDGHCKMKGDELKAVNERP